MQKFIPNDPQQEWINSFVAASQRKLETTSHLRGLWFRNPTNHFSLRLTHQGLHWIERNTEVEHYTVPIHSTILSKQLVQLERVFKAPYFLKPNSIIVFSSEDCIMLQLHAGDLTTYLNNSQL